MAKFNVGDVVKNNRGDTVRIICTDRVGFAKGEYPIVGLVGGAENPDTFTVNGQRLAHTPTPDDLRQPAVRIAVIWYERTHPYTGRKVQGTLTARVRAGETATDAATRVVDRSSHGVKIIAVREVEFDAEDGE